MNSDIKNSNLINSFCAKTPNYDLTHCLPYVGFYITLENKLVIESILDNNYISWFSVTSLQNKELNAQIFDYIALNKYDLVSNEAAVIAANGLGDILKYSFYEKLTRRPLSENTAAYEKLTRRPLSKNIAAVHTGSTFFGWDTPFGVYYGSDTENHGRYFANDVLRFAEKLKTQAEFKAANGKYHAVLTEYLNLISALDYMSYDTKIKPIYEALLSERYLTVSQNAETRRLYTACIDACKNKYNSYMSVARG